VFFQQGKKFSKEGKTARGFFSNSKKLFLLLKLQTGFVVLFFLMNFFLKVRVLFCRVWLRLSLVAESIKVFVKSLPKACFFVFILYNHLFGTTSPMATLFEERKVTEYFLFLTFANFTTTSLFFPFCQNKIRFLDPSENQG
jgi:hypothetical protein